MLDQNSAWHSEFSNFPEFYSGVYHNIPCCRCAITENDSIDPKLFSRHHYYNNNLLGHIIKKKLVYISGSFKGNMLLKIFLTFFHLLMFRE